MGTKGVPRAQREQLILDAATTEFGRFGYAGAALSAVAAQAGVSKPLVLGYFGSKDGLYIASVQRAGTNVIDHIETVLTPAGADHRAHPHRDLPRPGAAPATGTSSMTARRPPVELRREAAPRVRATIAEQAARGVSTLADLPHLTDPHDLSLIKEM